MVDILEALRNGLRSTFCVIAEPAAIGLSIGGNVYRGLGGEEQGDDLIASAGLFRAAAQVACNRQPDDVSGIVVPPFMGGQCDNVPYRVTQDRLSPNFPGNGCTSPATGIQWDVWGPINQVRQANEANPDLLDVNVLARPGPSQPIQVIPQLSGTFNNEVCPGQDLVITNIERLDGNPDNCGNPPPAVPPYYEPNWTSPLPITYDDNNGNPVSITPTVRFDPTTVQDGPLISVPFDITFEDGSSLFGDFNLTTGDINIGIGNSGGGGSNGDPIEDPTEQDPEEDGPVIVGARVVTTIGSNQSSASVIGQSGDNPDLYVPDIGIIAFRYETAPGQFVWGDPIRVKGLDVVIWSPEPAVEVAGSPRDPMIFQVTPIKRKTGGN